MFGNKRIEHVFTIKMKIKYGKSQQKNKKQKTGWQNKGDHWHSMTVITTTMAIREISWRIDRQTKKLMSLMWED